MHNFTKNLITEWRKLNLPVADDTFIVAVSGGADSVSLVLALNELRKRGKLNLRFVAAHFNHDLRGEESRADENFVREIAGKFNFELVCGSQNLESKIENQTGNLEQNARAARYEFLTAAAEKLSACGVLTAHTLNDQAETFLLNLIRGSGLEGLGGMKIVRSLESKIESRESDEKSVIRLARPLLNWARREDTENFCALSKVEFRYDAMNEDLKFNRVRIRKILLPLLKDFNPKIIETLARTSELMRESVEQLATVSGRHTASGERSATLSLKELREVFPSMRRTILRGWLKDNRGNLRGLELKHIEAVEQLVFSRKSGRVIELPNGETVSKEAGKLLFQKTKVEKSRSANYNQRLGSVGADERYSENNG